MCVHVYRQNSAHSGATSTHDVQDVHVRKTMEMDISNTAQAVNRTSKYMKKTKGRSANYTLAPYYYQDMTATYS